VTGFAVLLLNVPQAAVHAAPPCVSFQVTATLEVFITVAVNCCVAPGKTVGVRGATEIVTAGTVIVAEFDLVVSLAEVAVIVTVRAVVGGLAGAV
jgi:hypothetical protein